jgi:hypothetical protein
VNGLTEEQRTRLSLISNLESDQKDYLIAGILGIIDAWEGYESKEDTALELLDSIDNMVAKAYEKGRYI